LNHVFALFLKKIDLHLVRLFPWQGSSSQRKVTLLDTVPLAETVLQDSALENSSSSQRPID
jgi:hypothetical protein